MKILEKLVVCLVAVVIVSCQDEIGPEQVQNSAQKIFLNGVEVSQSSIDEDEDYIYVYLNPQEVHVFDSDKQFERYMTYLADDNSFSDEEKGVLLKAVEANKISRLIANEANLNNLGDDNFVIPGSMASLYGELERMAIQPELSSNPTTEVTGVVTLYDAPDLGSSSRNFPSVVPSIKKSWRDRASSLKVTGAGTLVLCDKTFFRGTKKVFVFPRSPFSTADNFSVKFLSEFGFDNRTASFF